MDGRSDHYTWDGRLLDEPEEETWMLLTPSPLRPAVANALEVWKQAIQVEMTTPRTADESTKLQALGWKIFARDSFTTLFSDQIADELTVEYLKADTDG